MLVGFEDMGEVWIVMNVQEGWPESAYFDEESAEEAVKQLQDANPDDFYKIVYSGLEVYRPEEEKEEDDWL